MFVNISTIEEVYWPLGESTIVSVVKFFQLDCMSAVVDDGPGIQVALKGYWGFVYVEKTGDVILPTSFWGCIARGTLAYSSSEM